MTDTPAPSVPTSPPAGPAVSPEIDALIDDVRDALRVTDDGKALASLAAVRTEVARLTKERDPEEAVRGFATYLEREVSPWGNLQREKLQSFATEYLRRISTGSAHKEKEWARSSDISGKEKE